MSSEPVGKILDWVQESSALVFPATSSLLRMRTACIIPGGPEAVLAIVVARNNKVEMTERAQTPPSPTEILPNTEASPPFKPARESGQPLQLLNTSNCLKYSQGDFKMPHRVQ
ncbi:hypothetical protein C8R47DRAFT_1068053 [Mycena vitilis]|nr:hypothetical protein C8R47DRAFT_1068053 [Mycena vitilis]